MPSFLVTVAISVILAFFNYWTSRLDTRRLSLVSQRVLLVSALRAYRSWIISQSQAVRISAYVSFRQQFYKRRQYLSGSCATLFANVLASYILILIGSNSFACLSIVIQLIKNKTLLMSTLLRLSQSFRLLGFPLGVKARTNKLNSPGINWRRRLSIGIRLFFGFNIIASKEYYLTIMGSLKV